MICTGNSRLPSTRQTASRKAAKSIGQNIVYGFAFVQPFFQNGGLPLQLLIGKAFVFVFQSQNAVRDLLQPPYLRVVALSQQLFEKIFHCHAG